ncbi:MAG: ABC transporter substrate-binding protein [Chloroflexi bacterium]|nr:ABC transporter substrate-binding protein [Chloroflexota bacterium]
MHPYIPELMERFRQGRVSRREFVQNATLLGLSLSAATAFLAACAQQQAAAPQPTVSAPAQPTRPPAAPPTAVPTAAPTQAPAAAATTAPAPAATAAPTAAQPASAVKRGGTLFVAQRLTTALDEPARFSNYHQSNLVRNINEYLSDIDARGVAQPHLLEKWEPSADLKTWTLTVRKGVKWNMPKPRDLDAEDVAFNLRRWVAKETASSAAALMNYLQPGGVEVIDKSTVKLHLDRGEFAVPYHFYHYPALVLPREFEGNWEKQPWGTGGFTLEEHVKTERAKLKRRPDYWRNGADGKSLPYVDEIIAVDRGDEVATVVASFAAGQADYYMKPTPSVVPAMEMLPNARVVQASSSDTALFRMRVDRKPFDDARVRTAVKLVQNREQLLRVAFKGWGTIGTDTHAHESQPDFVPVPVPKQDIARAKTLLAEAGYPNGIDVTMEIAAGTEWAQVACTVLKQQAEPAGIRIALKVYPATQWVGKWTEIDFGYTQWYHRPLVTMNYQLAYICGAAWNETRWCDKEFEKMLADASSQVTLEDRKKRMEAVERRLQEHGAIGDPFHMNVFIAVSKRIQNVVGNPFGYAQLYDVWLAQ